MKSSDVISSLEHCKIDIKSLVFIKAPRIGNIINARQHFLTILSSVFMIFLIFIDILKLTTLPAKQVLFTPIFFERGAIPKSRRSIMYLSSRSAPPASPSLHTILPKLPILSVVSPLPVLAGAALLVLFFESKNLPHIPFRYNQNVQGIKVYPAKPL